MIATRANYCMQKHQKIPHEDYYIALPAHPNASLSFFAPRLSTAFSVSFVPASTPKADGAWFVKSRRQMKTIDQHRWMVNHPSLTNPFQVADVKLRDGLKLFDGVWEP